MDYQVVTRGDGTSTISRIFRVGDDVKVVPTYLEFDHEEDAKKMYWAFEMVSSVWCYSGIDMKNKYLQEHIEEVGEKPILDEFNWLSNHCETRYAGEDSEGVWYNTIVYTGE